MARFNEILVGRFNRAVQKLCAIKGAPPTAQVSSEVGVQIAFNQMGPDFRYLEGWNVFGGSVDLAPSVGNANGIQFSMDNLNAGQRGATNAIGVLHRLQIITSLADVVNLSENFASTNNLGGAQFTGAKLDSRELVAGSALQISSIQGVVPALGLGIFRFQTQANVPYEIIPIDSDVGIPMNGVHNLRLNSQVPTLNVEWWVNFWWRERFLEDSERT